MSPLPAFQPGEILEASQLNQIVAELTDLRNEQDGTVVPVTSLATFQSGTTIGETSAVVNRNFVWFNVHATITPGPAGLLMTFDEDYWPLQRFVMPLVYGSSGSSLTMYGNGGVYAQYPTQTTRQSFRFSGYYPRASAYA